MTLEDAKSFVNAENMANAYLASYFGNSKIKFPINPFQMLKDEGIVFIITEFKKLEGVYIPREDNDDVPLVSINSNRPITRQRFTAAHELCHHFRDSDKQIPCPIGSNNSIEKFANEFAAALLMPISELRRQVNKRKNTRNEITFDDVLEIADYFGVSFESCLYRIAYRIHAISGNTENKELKKRIRAYKPDIVRKTKQLTYEKLYADLIDSYQEQLSFIPTDNAKYLFQNHYIYNDSRMEGIDVTIEEASEMVTDLRINMQNSEYCSENNEAYLSIAGHYEMYQSIFEVPVKDEISVFDTFSLNKKLFSCFPNPEFGGSVRQNNTLVLGTKFETVDYGDIYTELLKVDEELKDFYSKRSEISLSEYIKHVARIHHRLTQIHPFADGNGRTTRAFMNIQLVRSGIVPIYIEVDNKNEYLNALAVADKTNNYDMLYEFVYKHIIKSQVELKKQQI